MIDLRSVIGLFRADEKNRREKDSRNPERGAFHVEKSPYYIFEIYGIWYSFYGRDEGMIDSIAELPSYRLRAKVCLIRAQILARSPHRRTGLMSSAAGYCCEIRVTGSCHSGPDGVTPSRVYVAPRAGLLLLAYNRIIGLLQPTRLHCS